MWFIYWIVSIYVIAYLIYYGFQKKLKEVKDSYEKLMEIKNSYVNLTRIYDRESKMYKSAYQGLLVEYNKAISTIDVYKRTSDNMHINNDIKSALKFAMIYSHPDKGLFENADEFIKFKKLYDEYK